MAPTRALGTDAMEVCGLLCWWLIWWLVWFALGLGRIPVVGAGVAWVLTIYVAGLTLASTSLGLTALVYHAAIARGPARQAWLGLLAAAAGLGVVASLWWVYAPMVCR